MLTMGIDLHEIRKWQNKIFPASLETQGYIKKLYNYKFLNNNVT